MLYLFTINIFARFVLRNPGMFRNICQPPFSPLHIYIFLLRVYVTSSYVTQKYTLSRTITEYYEYKRQKVQNYLAGPTR